MTKINLTLLISLCCMQCFSFASAHIEENKYEIFKNRATITLPNDWDFPSSSKKLRDLKDLHYPLDAINKRALDSGASEYIYPKNGLSSVSFTYDEDPINQEPTVKNFIGALQMQYGDAPETPRTHKRKVDNINCVFLNMENGTGEDYLNITVLVGAHKQKERFHYFYITFASHDYKNDEPLKQILESLKFKESPTLMTTSIVPAEQPSKPFCCKCALL